MLPGVTYSSLGSADAIAIKVIPNPNNYSVSTWYAMQGYGGNPSSLLVDEYRALQDGNTVYINAANIVGVCNNNRNKACSQDTDCGSNTCDLNAFYTNIYVIAQNVGADKVTSRIFDQVVKSFKLNRNVGIVGVCSQKTVNDCTIDRNACVGDEQCVDNPDASGRICSLGCGYDSECSEKSFCNSDKAEVIRDTKRLGDMADMNLLLESYKNKNGHYPKLNSGTYIPNVSLSVWPSWNETLAQELGVASLPIDPVNMLGDCVTPYDGYDANNPPDSNTCWDEISKVFADVTPNISRIKLPPGSNIYMYITDPDGLGFEVQ